MSLKQLKDVTYFKLNNEINIPVNGSIPLAKDKEAITAFLKKMSNLIVMKPIHISINSIGSLKKNI